MSRLIKGYPILFALQLAMSLMLCSPIKAQQFEIPDTSNDAQEDRDWSFEADVLHYFLPGAADITTGIGIANYKSFHFEGRYNYEGIRSFSLFAGYRFEFGQQVTFGIVPMAGFVVGQTEGLIPGFELDITWKKLDFYSESEYVISLDDHEENYFYTWTELAISPWDHFRAGIAANRTRLYHSSLELDRSGFVEYSLNAFTAGVHYFNPFTEDDFGLVTLAFAF